MSAPSLSLASEPEQLHLSQIRGEVCPDEDSLHALDRQRLADDELSGRGNVPETAVLFLHEEFLAGIVVPGMTWLPNIIVSVRKIHEEQRINFVKICAINNAP